MHAYALALILLQRLKKAIVTPSDFLEDAQVMAKGDVLRNKSICLQPFSREYLTNRYVSWLNDPAVVRFSEQRHHTHSLSTCEMYTKLFDSSENYLWAITHEESAEKHVHIGNISATIDKPNATADIAMLIGEKAYWGRGLGTDAFMAVCHYLFAEKGIRKITAGTMEKNVGMLKIMQHSGMREECRQPRQFLLDGVAIDLIRYSIFREDFKFLNDTKKL